MIEFEIGKSYEIKLPEWNTYATGYFTSVYNHPNPTHGLCSVFKVVDTNCCIWKDTELDIPLNYEIHDMTIELISKHKQIKTPFLMGYKIND